MQSLRDQARIHGHTTKESLLSAFVQVSLRGRFQQATANTSAKAFAKKPEPNKDSKNDVRLSAKKYGRCFYCSGCGHEGSNCLMKNKGRKCFGCQKFGHIAADCPQKDNDVKKIIVL